MSSVLHALSGSSRVQVHATSNKLNVRASEIEDKLDVLNTTCSNINVSVGDVTVNTGDLETLVGVGNASLSSVDSKITACDTGAVVVSSSALPSGGASSSLQTAGNATLALINGKVTACDTGAVVVSSSALPSGGSTSANQSVANASLNDIDTSLSTLLGYVDGLESQISNLESSATTRNSTLSQIQTNTASSGGGATRSTTSIVSSSSVSAGSDIGTLSSSSKSVVLLGSTSMSGSIEIWGSQDGGTTYFFQESVWSMSDDSGNYYYHKVLEHPSADLKFVNPSSSSTRTFSLSAEEQNW